MTIEDEFETQRHDGHRENLTRPLRTQCSPCLCVLEIRQTSTCPRVRYLFQSAQEPGAGFIDEFCVGRVSEDGVGDVFGFEAVFHCPLSPCSITVHLGGRPPCRPPNAPKIDWLTVFTLHSKCCQTCHLELKSGDFGTPKLSGAIFPQICKVSPIGSSPGRLN